MILQLFEDPRKKPNLRSISSNSNIFKFSVSHSNMFNSGGLGDLCDRGCRVVAL